MLPQDVPIFRPKAVRRYTHRQENPVFPSLVSPKSFMFLWALFGIIWACIILAALIDIPTYSKCLAVLTVSKVKTDSSDSETHATLLLPAEALPVLKPGQRVFLTIEGGDVHRRGRILFIEPDVINQNTAQERFSLGASPMKFKGSVTVAMVRLDRDAADPSSFDYAGSYYEAQVEIGSGKLIELVTNQDSLRGLYP